MNDALELARAFNDLARAATATSFVTADPDTSALTGVITSTSPLRARVGLAAAATPVNNTSPGYTPTVGDVVVVTRIGHRQFISGPGVAVPGPGPGSTGPRGLISRGFKPTLQGGYGPVEAAIAGLSGLYGPTDPNRWMRAAYGLSVIPAAAPAAAGTPVPIITVRLRVGLGTTGTEAGITHTNFGENQRGYDGVPNIFGSFWVMVPPAAQQYTLTIMSTGPNYAIGAYSWLTLEDIGAF